MKWMITDKGDEWCRRLVDGEGYGGVPHYSRQSIGSRQFTRNGQNLVFLSDDGRACWVTFRPTPGKATRTDHLDCWENALFCTRNTMYLASELITEAVQLSCAIWGPFPKDGLITFIRPDKVKSRNPGYCYKCAGWKSWGTAKDGKPRLRAPEPAEVPALTNWVFRSGRGGKLKNTLHEQGIMIEDS